MHIQHTHWVRNEIVNSHSLQLFLALSVEQVYRLFNLDALA